MPKTISSFPVIALGLAVVTTCAILLFVQKRSLEKSMSITSHRLNQCEIKRQSAESKNVVLESNVILATRSTGKTISGEISLTDINNKKRTTADIFAKKIPTLVFRYSNTSGCSPCIEQTFVYLSRLKENVDPRKLQIVIIPNDMDWGQMLIQKNQPLRNSFEFYLANENGIGLPIDEAFVSYLSIVDGNKTSNVFVVDNLFLPLLEKYVNVLIENYK